MNLNKPKPFTPNKNQLAQDWQVWREEFLVYLKLSNAYTQFSEEQRALLLLNNMGTEAIKAMNQISFESQHDKKDMDILLLKFDEFFNPTLNEVEERFKFFSRRKHPDEDLDKYVLDMQERAAKCNFGDQSEKFILDMLILSMDKHLRDLIWASKLETLSEIIYNYKQYNVNQEKMKEISESMRENLNTESLKNAKLNNSEPSGKQPQARRICSKCGTNHAYRDCPAFDAICQMCSGKGHYTSKCTFFEAAYKASNSSQAKNKENEAATSKIKLIPNQGGRIDTLQHCLWCNSYHMPEKCPHDANCTSCNNFPHTICFQCKNNPHKYNCYYKNIVTLPVIENTDQATGHRPNAQPQVQRPREREPAEFVKITTSRYAAQSQRQAPNHTRQANANQRNQNTKHSANGKKKNNNSDSCCIS